MVSVSWTTPHPEPLAHVLVPGRSSQVWGWGGGLRWYAVHFDTGGRLSLSCGTRLRVCLVPGSLCFLIGCRSAHAWAQAGSLVGSDTCPVESPRFPLATAASVGDTALSLLISFPISWPLSAPPPHPFRWTSPASPDSARLCATFHVDMVSRREVSGLAPEVSSGPDLCPL